MSGNAVIKLSKEGHAFFWCPGCDGIHYVNVEPANDGSPRPVWGFNGSIDKANLHAFSFAAHNKNDSERRAGL